MKKKKTYSIFIALAVLAYILYAMLTGGVVVINLKWFGGYDHITFVKGLKGRIYVNSNYRSKGIPLVGFYDSGSLPCSLQISIEDTSKKYSELTLETISIEYTSGRRQKLIVNLSEKLLLSEQYDYSTKKKYSIMELNICTPECIDEYSDFDITLSGFIKTVDGKKVPFKTKNHFKLESQFRLSTLWEVYASC